MIISLPCRHATMPTYVVSIKVTLPSYSTTCGLSYLGSPCQFCFFLSLFKLRYVLASFPRFALAKQPMPWLYRCVETSMSLSCVYEVCYMLGYLT